MQWVVTTGRTIDEARFRALDALGIDEADLEWEVLEEPRSSLLGLRTTDARVRARVRPTRPRPKVDRRNRRKSANRGGRRRKSKKVAGGADTTAAPSEQPPSRQPARDEVPPRATTRERSDRAAPQPTPEEPAAGQRSAGEPGRRRRRGDRRHVAGVASGGETSPQTDTGVEAPTDSSNERSPAPSAGMTGATMSDIPLSDQEPTAVDFVEGLLDAFGADADVSSAIDEDDTLEIAVEGDDLGLLVGQRGATLNALQELTRTAVAQQHSGRLEGRLRVDVAGYRARRKEALVRFTGQQAERVKETGTRVALEPMGAADRKIVHDAVNEIDGVRTVSEGEDRHRHVVILPE